MVEILEKGQRTNIAEKSTQADGAQKFYFGMGWDPSGDSDLDLCVTLLNGQEVVDFVFYGKKKTSGIQLSEDNRTGQGSGDDEWVKISTAELPPTVDGLVISGAVYAGPDFSTVKNPHIRWCDGDNANSPELGKFPIKDSAFDGDTVLKVVSLKKTPAGWTLKADGIFSSVGKGTQAIKAAENLKV